MITTDRSRMAAYLNCPRLRYLNYELDGLGLQRATGSLPLVYGIAAHTGMAALRAGSTIEDAIAQATAELDAQFARGIHSDDPDELGTLRAEQQHLLEGTLHAWARIRLPQIQAEFDVVAIEKEINWELVPGALIDMVRCDVLERRRADGLLFYREYKTTSSKADENWQRQFEHNSQLLLNVAAIEETLGERVDGVLIEGLLKGRRAKDGSKTSPFFGRVIQQSPLCYGYKTGPVYSTEWSRSATKIETWKHMSAERWVYDVMTPEECAALFAPLPPIRPRTDLMARFTRQMVHQEVQIGQKLQLLQAGVSLDELFPMNDDHCYRYFGRSCPFEPLCFDPGVADDPIGSGLYEIREPHHPAEKDDV